MLKRQALCILTFCIGVGAALSAQITPPEAAKRYTAAHQPGLVRQFSEFLSIPNVAADPVNLEKNANFLLDALRSRGVDARLLALPGAPPVVFGQIMTQGAQHTIVFYAHYDGQPVAPSEWTIPPFEAAVRAVDGEDRIFARS